MPQVTIYHNPRCSTSRKALELLRRRGVEPKIIEYLKTPSDPGAAGLRRLLQKLAMRPVELIRRKEPLFKQLGLAGKLDDDQALIEAMIGHPILIERPIVVQGPKAVLGRPPERVLEIL